MSPNLHQSQPDVVSCPAIGSMPGRIRCSCVAEPFLLTVLDRLPEVMTLSSVVEDLNGIALIDIPGTSSTTSLTDSEIRRRI